MTILAIAMQYVNYPTKTLNESTRVIFTMLFGILLFEETIWHSRLWHRGVNGGRIGHVHACRFQIIGSLPTIGIIILTISLLCDGAISNLSEALMNQCEVRQDEFICRLYSIATEG